MCLNLWDYKINHNENEDENENQITELQFSSGAIVLEPS